MFERKQENRQTFEGGPNLSPMARGRSHVFLAFEGPVGYPKSCERSVWAEALGVKHDGF